ncbi:M9 family metallopeptidase [Streptomyces sp. NPDC018610]|uniref:M9 family metallopeptidase n=1 Tax=Streptomyces sp. NPDC018610 TaxID=3365049 RepID=UPI0037B2AB6E
MRTTPVRRSLGAALPLALAWAMGAGLLAQPAQARTNSAAAVARSAPATADRSTRDTQNTQDDVRNTRAVANTRGSGEARPAPLAQSAAATATEHVAAGRLKPSGLPPLSAGKDALKESYDRSVTPPSRPADHRGRATEKPTGKPTGRVSAPSALAAAKAAACDPADFTSRTGGELVRQIRASTTDCVNTLFDLNGADAYNAFREAQMTTVAQALRDNSASYPGDPSTGTPQLVLYLRAGYYVHWYDPGTVGAYGSALRTAIRSALDAFFASPHSRDVTDANGETLAEAVVLIDSAEENARYIYVVERLLAEYDASWNSSRYMLNAVNDVYTVTYRGHQVPEFVSAVQADPGLLDALYSFAAAHTGLLGTDQAYLTSNAGRELGRFLQHPGLLAKTRPLAAGLLAKSAITGRTAPLWVGVAEMTDSYDKANCSSYGTCDLQARLRSAVLTADHTCGAGIRVLAQQMTPAELSSTCAGLRNQDAYFHGVVRDSGPVAHDANSTIEVVVYDSSTDYQTYAGAMYGIDTDNGGMYLEGDPAAAGNQPRFIAYEAEWLRPDFQIWNLNHEYTHYLDGRFDMYGDFDAGVSTPTVWWIEGFAEYVSYSYRGVPYPEATAEAGRHTYALSTLFGTTYGDDTTRVYRWGYLAVRYMLEHHRADMDKVLGSYRTGDWNGARAYLTGTVGTRYDSDWYTWLASCAAGDCGGPTVPECTGTDTRELGKDCRRDGQSAGTGAYAYLYLYVPAGTGRLTITTSGGTGDADLYYSGSGWPTAEEYTDRATGPGNAHTLTVTDPPAGANYISLRAVDGFSGVSVTTGY